MFAYCNNNPVDGADPSGTWAVDKADGRECLYVGDSVYDRNKAIAYAQKWYDSFNREYYRYWSDCANFVSQCLSAGGIIQTETWHMSKTVKTHCYDPRALFSNNYCYNWDVGEAWSKASGLYDYFSSIEGNTGFKIESSDSVASMIYLHHIREGDLLFFFFFFEISHATIISKVNDSMIYFAGHTSSRFDEPLLDHFPSDGVYVVVIGN